MRVLVATDAWAPQVNGVVRTYQRLRVEVAALGASLALLTPDDFRTVPCPTYPEIRLALPRPGFLARRLETIRPDAVHIATEGPIGWMARAYCQRSGIPFTTAFHTRFADYVTARSGLPESWTWAIQHAFHAAGAGTMVATPSLAAELRGRGFERLLPWTRGVDTALFRPRNIRRFGADRPVFLYVGRVAVEKGIEQFLALDLPGQKAVVGDGPLLPLLRQRFPAVLFTGRVEGEALAECYASADVFVMPSRTETFGIVMLEAMASGVPVAAFPVTGPIDVIRPGISGIIDADLATAARAALGLDRARVRADALRYSWQACARLFLANIESAILKPTGRSLESWSREGSRRAAG
jgi:glycosyltransferase involved in cell wall biosynthesis